MEHLDSEGVSNKTNVIDHRGMRSRIESVPVPFIQILSRVNKQGLFYPTYII